MEPLNLRQGRSMHHLLLIYRVVTTRRCRVTSTMLVLTRRPVCPLLAEGSLQATAQPDMTCPLMLARITRWRAIARPAILLMTLTKLLSGTSTAACDVLLTYLCTCASYPTASAFSICIKFIACHHLHVFNPHHLLN